MSSSLIDAKRVTIQAVLVLTDAQMSKLSINDLVHKYWASKSLLAFPQTRSAMDHFKSFSPTGQHCVRDVS